MKLGISLSESTGKSLALLAKEHSATASAIVEVALLTYSNLPKSERDLLIRRHQVTKRVGTRSGWMTTFWDLLAEEFGVVDFARGNSDRCMVSRTHMGFDIIFLMHNAVRADLEDDGFIVHIFEHPPIIGGGTFPSQNFRYDRSTSVYSAVAQIAAWIRDHQHLVTKR